MDWPVIHKRLSPGSVQPNLRDYAAECAAFSWQGARGWLDGFGDGALNMAHEAVDRHVASGRQERVALRLVHRDESVSSYTFGDLATQSARFANVLAGLQVRRGERVFSLLGRRVELYVALLGALKYGAVFSPLFAAYGPEPVRQRLALGDARVLVTTRALWRRKVAPVRAQLPGLEHVILVDGGEEPDTRDWAVLMAAAAPGFATVHTRPDETALLHFTSGTTGTPKGAVHVHEAVVGHFATARFALDLHPEDVYWCTADPGWVTGTSYGVIAPLAHGVTMVVDEEEFDAARWWRLLQRERVTVWYTAPTALRMLMRGAVAERPQLPDLRFVASVGEPLNPEVVGWGQRALGLPVHDNWWQTETGGIMIANFAACDIKPGSMGRPLPGIEAVVVAQDEQGDPVLDRGSPRLVAEPATSGILALRAGWPSMFRGYLDDPDRYAACFAAGWYLTGDVVRRDDDGYFWFVGRGDDVIKSAGHLIGPFEVESALLEHPAVVEAGVVGRPDPVVGESVYAFVVLQPPYEASEQLRLELIGFARKRLGPAVAPRDIAFAAELPHTQSGKILRRVLKERL